MSETLTQVAETAAPPTDERLIERWLPIAALGIESTRERTPMTPYPAPNRLHVWWARRPLIASRAAVLASVLPAGADRDRFLHALGIHGDPVAARRKIDAARRTGVRVDNPYDWNRAFSYLPDEGDRIWLAANIPTVKPAVLDPTAGGGSIPFEAARLGMAVLANDLNPVAALIEKATIEYPLKHGEALRPAYEALATKFRAGLEARLAPHFPQRDAPDCYDATYLWAHTVRCPYCEGLVPLSPNWRLAPDGTGVRLKPHLGSGPGDAARRCEFVIVDTSTEHSAGTVADGDGTCPFPDCGRVIDGDEIKRQAQAGGMGEQLFAIVFKRRIETKTKAAKRGRDKWQRGYRAPRPEDDNSAEIAARLAEKMEEWDALDIVPSERFPSDANDDRPIQYGMPLWRDLFNPRQLLGHGTAVEVYRELLAEREAAGPLDDVTKAAFVYLAIALDKMLNWNARLSSWNVQGQTMRSVFDRHDFAFKWDYAEMAPLITGLGYDWVVEQVGKCIEELVELVRPDIADEGRLVRASPSPAGSVAVTCKSADAMDHIDDASVDVVVMDPPYYDNVMYAELSDFFYVWEKRTVGHVLPELFTRALTDKENEAVANPAKFAGEKGAKKHAGQDYQERMARIFEECRRVLKPNGIMTLMFTHKASGAWDSLTKGLIKAGFIINASWPINTEAEGSLNIRNKAAAKSTIFLVCRPRATRPTDETVYWEDVEPRVRRAVRGRIKDFQDAGIHGVDLALACFGPALSEFSRNWPMKRIRPRFAVVPKKGAAKMADDPYAVTPEDALDAARREVKAWRLEQLAANATGVETDALTTFFVLAWDFYKAPVFPHDEALHLARAVGVDFEKQVVGIFAEKKAGDLRLWDSATRASKGRLGPSDGSRAMLDAIHHAAHTARTKTLLAAKEGLAQRGLLEKPAFHQALKLMLEVLPPSQTFTGVDLEGDLSDSAKDFEVLENLRRLALGKQVPAPKQLSLWADEKAA